MLWHVKDLINYNGQDVQVSATHVLNAGCMTGMKVEFTIGGKCPLDLQFSGAGGVWSLQSGTLRSDAECGAGWGSGKVYTANASMSSARLVNVPKTVSSPGATSVCTGLGAKIKLDGTLVMSNGATSINVGLTMLRISGAIPSAGSAGDCGQAPPVQPDPDPEPEPDPNPEPDPEPEPDPNPEPDPGPVVSCPPNGTGKGQGSQIADFKAKDENGAAWSLHSLCGKANGIFMLQTAEW